MTSPDASSPRPIDAPARSRPVEFLLDHEFSIAFVALSLLVVTPVFLVDVPPLADYVNHLARMRVIAVEGVDPHLSAFYRIDWQLIPNLAMDLIVPALDRFLDIYRAGQIFTALTLLAMVTGPMAVHRALYGRYNAFPLVAFVLVYNGILLFGMMNYLLGVGLAMWGLALWIWLQERPLWLRLVVSTALCLVLYVCHLYAVGLYGLAIGSYELWAWAKRRFRFDRALALDLVALIVPVLPLVPLLMRSSTWGLVKEAVWDSQSKIAGLELVFRTYVDTHDLALLALGSVALGWALRRGILSVHGAAMPLAAFGFAVFLAMPYTLFGSEMADQRMPVALLLMLVGFVHLDPEDKWSKAGFLALVVGFAVLRVADVSSHWQRIGAVYADIRASLASVPRGARMLVSVADDPKGTETIQASISHAPCLAMIERSALVSTAFAVKGKQIMTVKPPYHDQVDTEDGEPPRVSQLVATSYVRDDDEPRDHFWDNWTVDDDYVFVLYTEREADNPDPSNLDLVWDGRNFQLYKVKKDEGAGATRTPATGRTPG
ncbi:MAG: hypothetical protein LWW93_11015 [Hyphomicrobiales bacterium]|nr:hypothetical protein [Hyphomicrobiales bacterium]